MTVAAGVFLGLLAAFTIAAIAWRAGRRDGLASNDVVMVHNDRLRVKARTEHERARAAEAKCAEMAAFLSVVVPEDWSA